MVYPFVIVRQGIEQARHVLATIVQMRGNAHPSKIAPAQNAALFEAVDQCAAVSAGKAGVARTRRSGLRGNDLVPQCRKPVGHLLGQIARVGFNSLWPDVQKNAQCVIQVHDHLHGRVAGFEFFRHGLFRDFGMSLCGLFGPDLEIVPAKAGRCNPIFCALAQITKGPCRALPKAICNCCSA